MKGSLRQKKGDFTKNKETEEMSQELEQTPGRHSREWKERSLLWGWDKNIIRSYPWNVIFNMVTLLSDSCVHLIAELHAFCRNLGVKPLLVEREEGAYGPGEASMSWVTSPPFHGSPCCQDAQAPPSAALPILIAFVSLETAFQPIYSKESSQNCLQQSPENGMHIHLKMGFKKSTSLSHR